jgi:hypothetical protein
MANPKTIVRPAIAAGDLATAEDLAPELGMSVYTLLQACRRGESPHVRLPHRRRVMFDRRHVAAFYDGAELEVRRLAGGGRLVRPVR